jgi:hypothetical protein
MSSGQWRLNFSSSFSYKEGRGRCIEREINSLHRLHTVKCLWADDKLKREQWLLWGARRERNGGRKPGNVTNNKVTVDPFKTEFLLIDI